MSRTKRPEELKTNRTEEGVAEIVPLAQVNAGGSFRKGMAALQRNYLNRLGRMRGTDGMSLTSREIIRNTCGYDSFLSYDDYYDLWDNDGIAGRIVEAFPDYTWSVIPTVYEVSSDKVSTPFEKGWQELFSDEYNPISELRNWDILSGIGHFGIMVIGVNDGKKLSAPLVPMKASADKPRRIVYTRSFTEGEVEITAYDENMTSPRYGKPVMYRVTPRNGGGKGYIRESSVSGSPSNSPFTATGSAFDVHYTRVLHFADGATSNKLWGRPRLKRTVDALTNILKIGGGSAEMFWSGGFGGLSFEMDKDAEVDEEVKDEMKAQISDYFDKIRRSLLLQGVSTKQLNPTIASPSDHIDIQLTFMSISSGIPKRILAGSEVGKLASTQDKKNWENRVDHRRVTVGNPCMLLPFVNFCTRNGIIPAPSNPKAIKIEWPPLERDATLDIARSAESMTTAVEAYCKSSLYKAITFEDYLTRFLQFSTKDAQELGKKFDMDFFESVRKANEKSKTSSTQTTKDATTKEKSRKKSTTVTPDPEEDDGEDTDTE